MVGHLGGVKQGQNDTSTLLCTRVRSIRAAGKKPGSDPDPPPLRCKGYGCVQ